MDVAHELGLHPETATMSKDSVGYGYESKPRVDQWMEKILKNHLGNEHFGPNRVSNQQTYCKSSHVRSTLMTDGLQELHMQICMPNCG